MEGYMPTDLIESMQNFLKKYDHIPHNEKSIKLLLAEEKFLKIKQVVEEEQTQPEYLQALLQSLLTDLQILNEIQPLKQEIPNQIQKDQRKKIEDMSIEEIMHEQQLVDREIKETIMIWQDFNVWGSEVRKKEKAYDMKSYSEYDSHSRLQNFDDFSLGECNLFDIDDSFYEKSTSRLAHLAPLSPEIVEVCVDDDDTDDDDDYDDDFYDCVDIEEDGGEIDFDISKIVDHFSFRSFSDNSILRGIESDRDSGEDTTSIDDLPLDDSMILPEYESFTFDDEPVMAEVNVFDEINTSELSTRV
ncbi:hypothetical protein Tco_1244901 [Tanacetum coccineum]